MGCLNRSDTVLPIDTVSRPLIISYRNETGIFGSTYFILNVLIKTSLFFA